MKRYEKYKDSGIAWIGKIPEHWDSCAIKRISKVTTGSTPPTGNSSYFESDDINWFTPSDFDESSIRLSNSNRKLSNNVLKDGLIKLYPANSVLIIGIGGTLGRIGYSEKECYSNQQINAISMRDKFCSLYYAYSMSVIKSYIWANANTATMPILNQTATKNLFIAVPTIDEQAKIAEYLDCKCGEVDRVVAVREEQIKLLGELRTSIISRAVTKGLNPDAPLKDSGIAWIGEIPAHWGNGRLKNFCSLKGRIGWKGLRSDEFKSLSYAYLVTGQDFTSSSILWSKCYQIDQVRYEEDPYIQLNNGDLLITKDGTIGKVAKVDKMDKPACLNSGIFVMKQKSNNSFKQDYLYWLLFSNALRDFNNFTSTGTTILHLYQNVFEIMPFIVPSLLEQQAIADYLDKKTAEIDSVVSKYKEQIDKLKEYRQALITEVVTGKIDVRNVVIPTQSNQVSN